MTYRISLRSSSVWEPRHPLLKVFDIYNSRSTSETQVPPVATDKRFMVQILEHLRVSKRGLFWASEDTIKLYKSTGRKSQDRRILPLQSLLSFLLPAMTANRL